MLSVIHVVPLFDVPMTTGLPYAPNPTAIQLDRFRHPTPLTPSMPGGIVFKVHVLPSSDVIAIASSPAV
jgi:hypothetical protein